MNSRTLLLASILALSALPSSADSLPKQGPTDCAEWATMTQILVLRWQGEHLPKPDGTQATNDDVKEQLRKTMKGHPELDYALTWVDYAWTNRNGNPVHVWQAAKSKCEGGSI